MNYKETYQEWITNPYFDEEVKAELRGIAEDEKEKEERFYTELEFGTAGLRGIIGAGTNRIDIHTVSSYSPLMLEQPPPKTNKDTQQKPQHKIFLLKQ